MIRGGCYSCAWRKYDEVDDCCKCGHPNFPEEDFVCGDDIEDCFFFDRLELPEDY